ncbi:MAG: SH3 domain-containing protein [bacterium]
MKGKVLASSLNVRARPDIQGKIVGALPTGKIVEILGQKGGWFEISYQGHSAFVSDDYIEVIERMKAMKGVVTTQQLNIRNQPSLNGDVIGGLVEDTVVDIIAQHGDWLEIEFNAGLGFVHSNYVDLHEAGQTMHGIVNANLLNVRRQPKLQAEIAGQLARDATVNIISRVGNWFEIHFNGSTAYVHSEFIDPRDDEIDELRPAPYDDTVIEDEEEADVIPHAPEVDEPDDTIDAIPLEPSRKLTISGTSEEQNVARTWNKFGNLLTKMSNDIGIDPGSAVAVLCVESSGKGFERDNRNRMIIRFENHKFWKFWGKQNAQKYRLHFQYKKGEAWKEHKWRKEVDESWQKFHGRQSAEWNILEFARALDDSAALKSISMGAPQIMGFHHKRIGYDSVQEMFDKFSNDIRYHILGLFGFFSPGMVQALKKLDFVTFAKGYNGSGQMEKYGKWIRNHYNAYKQLLT